jgi:hypothetical protein
MVFRNPFHPLSSMDERDGQSGTLTRGVCAGRLVLRVLAGVLCECYLGGISSAGGVGGKPGAGESCWVNFEVLR